MRELYTLSTIKLRKSTNILLFPMLLITIMNTVYTIINMSSYHLKFLTFEHLNFFYILLLLFLLSSLLVGVKWYSIAYTRFSKKHLQLLRTTTSLESVEAPFSILTTFYLLTLIFIGLDIISALVSLLTQLSPTKA